MKLVSLALTLSFFPIFAFACENESIFSIGSKAIEAKYPEWNINSERFLVKEFDTKWMIVRKEHVYQEKPQEYPRAYISKKDCKVERIFWSK